MFIENEKLYKALKSIWQYAIPSIIFVWGNISLIWHIPYGIQIFGTIFALWVGFGIFLGICKYNYKKTLQNYLPNGMKVDLPDEGGDK